MCSSDLQYPLAGVIFDQKDNLYGTTIYGGTGTACLYSCGTVFELTPANGTWTEAFLYSFQGGSDGAYPEGSLVSDDQGDLYGTTANGGDSTLGCISVAQAFGGTYIVRVDVDHWEGLLGGSGLDNHDGEPLPAFIAISQRGHPIGEWVDRADWASDVPELAAPVLAEFFHWP